MYVVSCIASQYMCVLRHIFVSKLDVSIIYRDTYLYENIVFGIQRKDSLENK